MAATIHSWLLSCAKLKLLSCSVTLFLFRSSTLNELLVTKYEIREDHLRMLYTEKREVEKQQTGLREDALDIFRLPSSELARSC
jgi:hypothetical protein